MKRLRASWTVTAGVVPGMVESGLSRSWFYTGTEYDEDLKNGGDMSATSHFTRMMTEANNYATTITNPASINWVRVDFMWY